MIKDVLSNIDIENFFDSFVRQTIKDLHDNKIAYAFYQEQVDEIKKVYSNIIVKLEDGIYVLTIA